MFVTTQRQRRRGPCPRPTRFQPQLEALEDRTLLTASWLTGFGALGDSLTNENLGITQRAGAQNWVEQIAEFRDINFGAFNANWGAPRGVGYEYNWAGGGPATTDVIANGLHTGLAAQVAAGQVGLAAIGGANADLVNAPGQGLGRYQAIYNGTLTGTALTSLIDEIATNIATIVDTVANAGNVRLLLWNVADLNSTPQIALAGFTDPVGRQRYSDAVAALNVRIEAIAAQRGIPVIDLFTYSRQIIEGASWVVGGVPVDMTNFVAFQSNPTHLFEDSGHPGTIGSGLLANAVIAAANRAYGADITPFSDQELLAHAGLTPPTQEPTFFDVSPFWRVYGPKPGTLDPTFGTGGLVTTDFGGSADYASDLAVQPDGKVVLVGYTYSEATGDSDFAVARYNINWSLDTTFGPDQTGRVTIDFGSAEDYGIRVALQPDGKVLVVGTTYNSATGQHDFAVARLLSNGALDTSFDLTGDSLNGGRVAIGFDGLVADPARWNHQAWLRGDKLVVAGGVSGGYGLVRLDTAGGSVSVDTSFGTEENGRVYIPFGGWYSHADAVMQADGRIVIAGEDGRVLRLDAEGRPDETFIEQTLDFSAYNVALDGQGNVLVSGRTGVLDFSAQDMVFARLHADGGLDTSFGTGGEVRLDFDTDHEAAGRMVLQADGKIFVEGAVWQATGGGEELRFAVARLTPEGDLDPSFGSGGRALFNLEPGWGFITIHPDGGILLPGTNYRPDTNFDFALVRLIGFTDTDRDSIDDFVDPQATTFSNDFSDGTTTGSIISRGDQNLTIVNALDSEQGVVITANTAGGNTPATIGVVGGLTLSLSPGDQVFVTHGVVLRVVTGIVEASFVADSGEVGTVNLASGNALIFESDTATLSAPGTNTLSIEVLSNGTTNILDPGESLSIAIPPSRIQGLVWEDFNNNGEVDFGEKAIVGVVINLTGTDDRGHSVSRTMTTDGQGIYEFLDLRPGIYTITATQPSGYVDGLDSLGAVNSVLTGLATVNDQFSQVVLVPGSDGVNYNFGERPPSGGAATSGQTAAIGFWQNKHGQNLIKALNGGPGSTQLADWLAATFVNMYGANAGDNDLTGKTNAQVADFFTALFKRNGQTAPGGPPKVDAQVLATALAVYVTNETLAGTTAAAYGFQVTATGVGTATVNVGGNGAAFGVANNTTMTVLDILLATDAMTVSGLLYDLDGSGTISTQERALRVMANQVYEAINEMGNI